MILFKVVSVYIIFFELYKNLFAAPLSHSWGVSRKSNLNDLEVKKHETFFMLIGLGQVFERIGVIIICIGWLFFK